MNLTPEFTYRHQHNKSASCYHGSPFGERMYAMIVAGEMSDHAYVPASLLRAATGCARRWR